MGSPTVFIVDDDSGVRKSLSVLLATANLKVEGFVSAGEFLGSFDPDREGVLVLDVRMPGMSGPELQYELSQRGSLLPIIFLTAHGELTLGITAMKNGAADFLTKPIDGALLLERVQIALEQNRERFSIAQTKNRFFYRLAKLTIRERAVLAAALSGRGNKEIAVALQTSTRTIEGHRSRIYLKIGIIGVIDLIAQAANAHVTLEEICLFDARSGNGAFSA